MRLLKTSPIRPVLDRLPRARRALVLLIALVALVSVIGAQRTAAQEPIDGPRRAATIQPFRYGAQQVTPDLVARPPLESRIAEQVALRRALVADATAQAHLFVRFDGPLANAARRQLAELGISLLRRLDEITWVAGATAEGAGALDARDDVLWADTIDPATKLAPGLLVAEVPQWRERPGDRVVVSVRFHEDVAASEVIALAGALGAELEGFTPETFPTLLSVRFVIDPGQIVALSQAETVALIGPSSPPPEPENDDSQALSRVDVVQGAPFNLSGAGVAVGVWEAEGLVRDTHDSFETIGPGGVITSRVILQSDAAGVATHWHATHVAGTIGAQDTPIARIEGMAPASTLASWTALDDTVEMVQAVTSAGNPGDPTPVRVSNHSYGVHAGWRRRDHPADPPLRFWYRNNAFYGRYTFRAETFDRIVVNHDLIAFKSAGNERDDFHDPAIPNATALTDPANPDLVPPAVDPPPDCNTGGLTTPGGVDVDADCLSPVATAKNIITVGATVLAGTVADLSSFGPTDDGRIKPDLVARGVAVESTHNAHDTATLLADGTSMSSPVGAGVAALMLEQLDTLGETITAAGMKALLIQTATDVTADHYARAPGEAAEDFEGPDFATGWGLINAEAAARLLRLPAGPGIIEDELADEGEVHRLRYPIYIGDLVPELKVTLAWSDPPGNGLTEPVGAQDAAGSTAAEGPGTAAGVVAPVLVNNLDLVLISPTGQRFTPWRVDPDRPDRPAVRDAGADDRNNVEQVSVEGPESGLWLAEVSTGVGEMPQGPQAFALAGPLSGIKIVQPTRDLPARAGTPTNGSHFLVRLRASEGLDTALANLTIAIDGDELTDVSADRVIIHTNPGPETWIVIDPAPRAVGCYDLTIALVDIPDLTDTASQSVCYHDVEEAFDRFIAVDRTGSMHYNSVTSEYYPEKMEAARRAASTFVALSNPEDLIGLLSFQLVDENDDYTVQQDELTRIEQPLIRAESGGVDNLPSVRAIAEGITPSPGNFAFPWETSIGAAIARAWQELDDDGDADAIDNIVLVTDGLENYPPYWDQEGAGGPLKEELAADPDLIIHTVGVGLDADLDILQDIATTTGGLMIPLSEGEGSYSLLSRLTTAFKVFDEDLRGEQRFFYREGVPETVYREFDREGSFMVEPHLDWMTVAFHWDNSSPAGVTLIAPDGSVEMSLTDTDDRHTTYRVLRPEPGEWLYRVPGSIHADGEFTAIASAPTSLGARLVIGETAGDPGGVHSTPVRVWIAEAVPVSGSAVTAVITRPDRSKATVTLRDDGASADGAAGDGVYGFLAEESLPGGYLVDVSATGEYADAEPFERYMVGAFVIPGKPTPPPSFGEGRPGGSHCLEAPWFYALWAAFLVAYMLTLLTLLWLICYFRTARPATSAD